MNMTALYVTMGIVFFIFLAWLDGLSWDKEPALQDQGAGRKRNNAVIMRVISEQLGASDQDVGPQARIVEDLGADSLDLIELCMALEEEFGIHMHDEDMAKLHTVGDVTGYIQAKMTNEYYEAMAEQAGTDIRNDNKAILTELANREAAAKSARADHLKRDEHQGRYSMDGFGPGGQP